MRAASFVRAKAQIGQWVLTVPRLSLVLFCLAVWSPGLFTLPPGDRDESRFAQATRQMVDSGDYLRIMNGTEPRNRKPIGIHWLQAPFEILARAAGIATANPIWPYRLASVLGGLVAVLATFDIALVLGLDRRAALVSAAMLGGCVLLVVETHIAKTDAALLGATTLAMLGLARAWMRRPMSRASAAMSWLALGAGILLKGPVAPMVVGLAALCLVLVRRRTDWLRVLRPAAGFGIALAVVLPWFVAIGFATHGAFFRQAVGGDLGAKLAGGSETHGGPPGLHLVLIALLAFPASGAVFAALPNVWTRRREPAVQFLAAWIVPAWLVFEAVPTKLPHYTMPLYPALFILGGRWLASGGLLSVSSWARTCIRLLPALVAGALAIAALALPVLLHERWYFGVPAALAALLCAWALLRGRVLLALPAMIVLTLGVLELELPHLNAVWIAPRTTRLLRQDWPQWNPDARGLAVAGYAEPSLMFETGTQLRLLFDGRAAAEALAGDDISAVLVEGHDVAGFDAEAARRGMHPRRGGIVDGFNYSRGRWASLQLFLK